MFNVYRTQTPHVHCLIIFNQHDYTDCTELTNGKVKTENGKLVYRTQKAQKTQNFTDLF